MPLLHVGLVGTSLKENERRVAIHPHHLCRISHEIRKQLIFEIGYGLPFGVTDYELREYGVRLASRDVILAESEMVVLPKAVLGDLRQVREGGIYSGWPHCVQQKPVTDIAIERKLTMIAWEAMFAWRPGGARDLHVFHKNNELAGFCSVIHALGLLGIDGHYGPSRKVVVLSFGCVSRGAVYALQGRGYNDITVFTQRPTHLVHDQVYGCMFGHMRRGSPEEPAMVIVAPDGTVRPLIEELAQADVIVNGILQDTDNPVMFLSEHEVDHLKPGCLIIDGSCDLGMGFPFAKPTTFEHPIFNVGQAHYYAVDHTPSYLWNSATWEVSSAFLPYLETLVSGPQAWAQNETIAHAIEIAAGVIQNPKILSFQNRAEKYPHAVLAASADKFLHAH